MSDLLKGLVLWLGGMTVVFIAFQSLIPDLAAAGEGVAGTAVVTRLPCSEPNPAEGKHCQVFATFTSDDGSLRHTDVNYLGATGEPGEFEVGESLRCQYVLDLQGVGLLYSDPHEVDWMLVVVGLVGLGLSI